MITLGAPIGAGKSSLTQILSEQLGTKAFFEPVTDNPVLPLFYKGNEIAAKKRANGDKDATNPYAYLLQTFFLNRRFSMIKKAMQDDNNVLDRSIYEDELFMRMNVDMGNATEIEYDVYKNLLDNMMEEYPLFSPGKKAPDLMVMIHVSYPTMIRRITKRGREFEQIENDPSLEEYYKNLLKYYDQWEKEYDISPLLIIDGDKYDFMESLSDRREVLHQIYDKLLEVGSITKAGHDCLMSDLLDLKLEEHSGEYDATETTDKEPVAE